MKQLSMLRDWIISLKGTDFSLHAVGADRQFALFILTGPMLIIFLIITNPDRFFLKMPINTYFSSGSMTASPETLGENSEHNKNISRTSKRLK